MDDALVAVGRARACGARGAAWYSPATCRAPLVRQKREEGGGDFGRRMWRAGGVETTGMSPSCQRARRARRCSAPGGCGKHAQRMGAAPPPAAAPPRTGGWAIEACAGSSAGRRRQAPRPRARCSDRYLSAPFMNEFGAEAGACGVVLRNCVPSCVLVCQDRGSAGRCLDRASCPRVGVRVRGWNRRHGHLIR